MIQNLGTFSLFDKNDRYVHVRIDLDGSKLAAFAAEAANRIAAGEHPMECSAITVTVEEDEVQDVQDEKNACRVTDHAFTGASSTCDYPVDHWHPEDRSEPTEATFEVCGLAEDEHVS